MNLSVQLSRPIAIGYRCSLGPIGKFRPQVFRDVPSLTPVLFQSRPITALDHKMADSIHNVTRPDPPARNQSSTLDQDFVRQQVDKQHQGNFHSSSLKNSEVTMVSGSSVNRTALHPGGVL